MTNLLERMGISMPYYYRGNRSDIGNWRAFPSGWRKRFTYRKSDEQWWCIVPYFSDDKVDLCVEVENPNSAYIVYERFGTDIRREISDLGKSGSIPTKYITREGEVEYYFNLKQTFYVSNEVTLCTANVVSLDRFLPWVLGSILLFFSGGCYTLLAAIVAYKVFGVGAGK